MCSVFTLIKTEAEAAGGSHSSWDGGNLLRRRRSDEKRREINCSWEFVLAQSTIHRRRAFGRLLSRNKCAMQCNEGGISSRVIIRWMNKLCEYETRRDHVYIYIRRGQFDGSNVMQFLKVRDVVVPWTVSVSEWRLFVMKQLPHSLVDVLRSDIRRLFVVLCDFVKWGHIHLLGHT